MNPRVVYCPRCRGAIVITFPEVAGVDLVSDDMVVEGGPRISFNHRLSVRFDSLDVDHECPSITEDKHKAFEEEPYYETAREDGSL